MGVVRNTRALEDGEAPAATEQERSSAQAACQQYAEANLEGGELLDAPEEWCSVILPSFCARSPCSPPRLLFVASLIVSRSHKQFHRSRRGVLD